jgi:FMN phosphatase YigB (HAD superfamily)
MEKRVTVSFDLDGTLTQHDFADGVWNEGIPAIVAQRKGICLKDAQKLCAEAYTAEGDASIKWYQLGYWLEQFGINDIDVDGLISGFTHKIGLFDDVLPAIDILKKKGFRLIIFSNASRPFLDREVRESDLSKFFDDIISLPDDWDMVKAEARAFSKLRCMTDGGLIHVGDHISYDYEVPKSIGIEAFHIWRGTGPKNDESLSSLRSLADRMVCA